LTPPNASQIFQSLSVSVFSDFGLNREKNVESYMGCTFYPVKKSFCLRKMRMRLAARRCQHRCASSCRIRLPHMRQVWARKAASRKVEKFVDLASSMGANRAARRIRQPQRLDASGKPHMRRVWARPYKLLELPETCKVILIYINML
jgi:hypothetical protein